MNSSIRNGIQVPRPVFLEGLRGCAAWMVVFGHLLNTFIPALTGGVKTEQLPFLQKLIPYTPLGFFSRAHFAVIFFFVHSGLVLSFSFFTKNNGNELLAGAAIRRYPRLALPAAGSIFFAYILCVLGVFYNHDVALLVPSGWADLHFRFQPRFFEAFYQAFYAYFFENGPVVEQSYNSSLWTIAYEIQGSFLVFSFLALFGRYVNRIIAYGAFFLIFKNSMLLSFGVGILLCDLYVHHLARIKKTPTWAATLMVASGFYLGTWLEGAENFFFYSPLKFLYSHHPEQTQIFGAAILILGCMALPKIQSIFQKPFFQFLGHISYSVYLLHLSLLCSAGCGMYTFLSRSGASQVTCTVSAMSVTIILTLALATAYRKWVDEPSIKFAKKLSNLGFIFQRGNST